MQALTVRQQTALEFLALAHASQRHLTEVRVVTDDQQRLQTVELRAFDDLNVPRCALTGPETCVDAVPARQQNFLDQRCSLARASCRTDPDLFHAIRAQLQQRLRG